jgi:3D (Asp-Asp-Asp) domain-containing protein
MQREITGKDMIYFLLLSVILTFCVVIANKVETNAKTPEVTEITTEATTEESSTVEETTDIPLTTVKFEDIPDYTELGTFKLTAYCSCSKCCGKSDGITASGTKAKANHTVATDSSIPFGTELNINGNTYIVEDRGVKGNVVDIFFDSHEEAQNFGVKYAKVFEVN